MKTLFKNAVISVAGASHPVRALAGRESISTLFSYEARWVTELPVPSPADLVGAVATLTLDDRLGNARTVSGVVAECQSSASELGFADMTCTLRPSVYALTLGRSSRTFQSMTLKRILSEVLGGAAGSTAFSFASDATIAYRVQRNESDWDFIERTLSDAGLFYFFDHAAGSSLVIADGLRRGPELEGGLMPVYLKSMVGQVHEGIIALGATDAASTSTHSRKNFR